MKYQVAAVAILAICLTVDVRAGELECGQTITSCTSSQSSAFIANDCAGKKPFFDCLKNGECTTSMTIYKTTSTARMYDGCGASSIAMGISLPILMFSLAKLFSQ